MRKAIHFEMSPDEAWAEWRRAPSVHLSTTDAAGQPILRTVHGVVVDDAIAFHGADAGEKLAGLGRPAVMQCERTLAEIPSHFLDPERACPATTFFVSCQAHGTLERVEDPDDKARVLAALMARFQPEGGYTPITAEHPLYRRAVASILIVRLRPETMTGKRKLGQNRKTEEIERVLAGLWRRGQPGDLIALELVRRHHPGRPRPAFLSGPAGTDLGVQPGETDLGAAAALVGDAYWNTDTDVATIRAAHAGASAWDGARDGEGRLIATARAVSDGAKHAHIYDVAVAPSHRGRGIGKAILSLMLDHPRVRHCSKVNLVTRDAQPFYAAFGFAAFRHRDTEMRRKPRASAAATRGAPH